MNSIKTLSRFPVLLLCALCLGLAVLPTGAVAEDIDIFVHDNSAGSTFDNPNVLIVLDNTSNWSRNDQGWQPTGTKQGQAELQAIKTVIGELNPSVSVGLMLFTDTGTGREGGYIRFPVLQMTDNNKVAFQVLVQNIYNAFGSPTEKSASSANYSAVMFDVFKYFGGYTSPANVAAAAAGAPAGAGSPPDATHFGPLIFNQLTDPLLAAVSGAFLSPPTDPTNASGYTDGSRLPLMTPTTYFPPISTGNQCAKNFIIFIGNGFPNADMGSPALMDTYLAGVGGNTTQLAVPGFTTQTTTAAQDLGYTSACYATQSACTTTDFASQCGPGLTYPTCSCSATSKTTLDACPAGQSRYQVLGNTTTSGTTTGPTAGTPTTASAPTTACYATATAASTAVSGGTDNGGLPNPATTTTISGSTTTVTTYTSAWSVNSTAVSPNTCADTYGSAGTPTLTNSTAVIGGGAAGDSSACYLDKSNYVSSDTAGMTCPADTATTHYVCTYALKANPNNGSTSDCPGVGPLQQKRYAVTQTATPYPIIHNFKYTVTRTSTPHVTTTTGASTTSTVLGNSFACYSSAPATTPTEFPCTGYTSCTYGAATTANACPSGARYLVQGSATSTQVVSNNTFAVPPIKTQRMTDEWSRFLYQTDANGAPGQQNISTYTIDVFKAKQDADQTALLMSMARVGGGKYYAATSQDQIVAALRDILGEIQSVNAVFASASLPVNATNRAQNENQVFIGMFRPNKYPIWYGNLKRYQLANFSGVIDLADFSGLRAVNLQTGFVSECATSWWTSDSVVTNPSGPLTAGYWNFVPSNPPAQTKCLTSTFDKWSDTPDGPLVEKGAAAEVLRKGNSPTATDSSPTWQVNRSIKTLNNAGTLVDFTASVDSVIAAGMVSGTPTTFDFARGVDVNNENGFNLAASNEVRASVHGDVVHSRPLPVNYDTATDKTKGVTVFYGANDGMLKAVNATTGKERWAFVAPQTFPKFSRLMASSPLLSFPSWQASPSQRKDYFFDGSIGIYQNLDNTNVSIFASMRRGGRMIYAFEVHDPDNPVLLWKLGCTNLDTTDTASCSAPDGTDVSGIGQTWSLPAVAFIKGYPTNPAPPAAPTGGTVPVIVVGGGYDPCEDANSASPACSSGVTGNKIYVIRADNGYVVKTFSTLRSVASDVAMVDVNNDGLVDFAYVGDTGGNLYRVDFVNGTTYAPLAYTDWKIYRVAKTTGTGNPVTGAQRKFFYPPALLFNSNRVYVALGTGDREHPLRGDYPFTDVLNRFYVYLDTLASTPTAPLPDTPTATDQSVDLDDTSQLENKTTSNSCTSDQILVTSPKKGWFMDLNQFGTQDANGLTGEQTVTSALILGGLVTFSTNRPLAVAEGSCSTTLGEARGYWVNLLSGAGAIGVGLTETCGGDRASTFVGGGLPPSPVTGTVPVEGVNRTVVIGAVQRDGSASAPIGGQKVVPTIKAVRKRVYWFKNVDN